MAFLSYRRNDLAIYGHPHIGGHCGSPAADLLLNLRQISALDRLMPCKTGEGPSDGYCGTLDVWHGTIRSIRKLAK